MTADDRKRQPSQADMIVAAALADYHFFTSTENKPYAVYRGGNSAGGGIARPLALKGSGQLMNEFAKHVWEGSKKAVTPTALATARQVLLGYADDGDRVPVHLRVGWRKRAKGHPSIVIDLGDDDERVVEVTSRGWRVLDVSPVIFRRTVATSALPVPKPGGDVKRLRPFLNITDEEFDLFVAREVTALVPGIPIPILHLRGEPGCGKSDAGRISIRLIDPQPKEAELRALSDNPKDWYVSATNSHALAIDNASKLQPWQSDAMCGAVTGIADARRKLYADDELTLLTARCVLTMTGVHTVGIRNDLDDRMMTFDLDVIPEGKREEENVLLGEFESLHPLLFGALLDILSAAMRLMQGGSIVVPNAPRMADFARWTLAVDKVRHTDALSTYLTNINDASKEAVANDVLVPALESVCRREGGTWRASASEWVHALEPFGEVGDKEWPRHGNPFSQRLNLISKQLRDKGWTVTKGKSGSTGRFIEISLPSEGRKPTREGRKRGRNRDASEVRGTQRGRKKGRKK